jgi:ESS family glutamate:Na+ symporter
MGVLAGSVTLTGGPATGLPSRPSSPRGGLAAPATLAVASRWSASSPAGIMGGPDRLALVERRKLRPAGAGGASPAEVAAHVVEAARASRRRARRRARTSKPTASSRRWS